MVDRTVGKHAQKPWGKTSTESHLRFEHSRQSSRCGIIVVGVWQKPPGIVSEGRGGETCEDAVHQRGVGAWLLTHSTPMREFLRKNVPLIRQLGTYDADAFRGDVAAGVTVGVMLIPQGMAYALIAGLPPVHGLYAALLPPLLYALFGSSRHLSVGPTALVSLLVASGVAPLVDGNPQRYVVLAMCLAALVGLIQMGMAFIRVGVLTDFLSEPVLTGFSAAAALIIGLSQLEHLLGVSLPQSEYIYVILAAVFESLGQVHLLTVALGVGGIVLIEVVERWWEALPSSLIAVVAAPEGGGVVGLSARGAAGGGGGL